MNRWVLSFGIFLAAAAVLIFGITTSGAVQDGTTSRYKTVEIDTEQYVWELVSNQDGRVICQVILDRPTRPTNEEALTICAEQIFPSEPTPTPLVSPTPGGATPVPGATPEPFDLAAFFRSVAWRFVTTRELTRTIQVPVPEMIINLVTSAPDQKPYYASIYAYEPVIGEQITGIYGILNGWPFTCPSTRCDVPITESAVLEFWAVSTFGDESDHMQAIFRVDRTDQGERVELTSLQPVTIFADSCAAAWGQLTYNVPEWAKLPPLPDDLHTNESYQILAGRLLFTGVAKASECPNGGLWPGSASPNNCGLASTQPAVTDWQNQFDVTIWDAGRRIGIPPRIIKTLIEQESQFWPGNALRAALEFGLGQMNQTGADVAMRWDNDLFLEICNGMLFDCSLSYGRLSSDLQATLRGALMRAIDAECATCPQGIDLARANESIPILARTLRSNCWQVRYILDTYGMKASYEDLWKFTLVSYHSGYQCLDEALAIAEYNDDEIHWENVSEYLGCGGGQLYVDTFWKSLLDFDNHRVKRAEPGTAAAQPTFDVRVTPTPTATPQPTSVPSLARIRVLVYVDRNNNNYPEPNERVDGVAVEVQTVEGQIFTGETAGGEAVFDLTGLPVGSNVSVSLPGQFRSQTVRLMRDGEIPVVFRLEQPPLPPVLP